MGSLQEEAENEVKHAQMYIFHACMHKNTHLWVSQSGVGGV